MKPNPTKAKVVRLEIDETVRGCPMVYFELAVGDPPEVFMERLKTAYFQNAPLEFDATPGIVVGRNLKPRPKAMAEQKTRRIR